MALLPRVLLALVACCVAGSYQSHMLSRGAVTGAAMQALRARADGSTAAADAVRVILHASVARPLKGTPLGRAIADAMADTAERMHCPRIIQNECPPPSDPAGYEPCAAAVTAACMFSLHTVYLWGARLVATLYVFAG